LVQGCEYSNGIRDKEEMNMCIPNIKNAYENIVHACERRLSVLYPLGIPEVVQNRYDTELNMLKHSAHVDDFEIFRLLNEEGKKTSQYISTRGMISGSFIAYLLGYNRINPLQAHYYCKKCGYMEVVNTRLFGLDLPEITCPNCNETLMGDGYNLPLESVWGTNGKKHVDCDYNISSEFLPFARRVLEKAYPDNHVVSYGMMISDERRKEFDPKSLEIKQYGYVILPLGRTIEAYPEIVTYLEDGEPCITGSIRIMEEYGLRRVMLISHSYVEYLMQMQKKSGIYAHEIGNDKLRELNYYDLLNTKIMNPKESKLFRCEKPQNFYGMVNYSTMPHNTVSVLRYDDDDYYYELKEKVLDSSDFKKFPCYNREDFFDYFLECGCDRETAFNISEEIRKGRALKSLKLEALQVPEELKNVARMYRYIFPKGHSIEYLLMYARLAYYMKWNSRVYNSVLNKKKM